MSELRVTVYTAESPLRNRRRLFGAMARDIVASRHLAWRLFVRDIRALYRQSMLGYVWAFVPPLVTGLSFTFLNAQGIINIGPTAIPYPAFVVIGTVLWQTFVDALNSPLKSVGTARPMLAKVNFPREALLLSGMMEVVFNFGVRATILVLVFAYYRMPVSPSLLLFPGALLCLISLGLAIGLLLLPLALLYSDVGRAVGVATTFWMLLTPVVYPPPTSGLGALLAEWNPVSPALQVCRDLLAGQSVSFAWPFVAISAAAFVALLVGWLLYRLTMPILIERMGG